MPASTLFCATVSHREGEIRADNRPRGKRLQSRQLTVSLHSTEPDSIDVESVVEGRGCAQSQCPNGGVPSLLLGRLSAHH